MPIISILLLITLLVALFLYPNSSSVFSMIILTISIGAAIIFTVHRDWETLQQAQEPEKSNGAAKNQFIRNTFLDLLGLALTMGVAIWLGHFVGLSVNSAGSYAGQAVGMEAGQTWGLIAGIVVGMGAGFAGALIAGRAWGRVSEPLRSEPETV